MNGYRMPSRVNAIKWLGVLQLIHGILIFIITIVLFAIDFEASTRAVALSGGFYPRVIYGFLLAFLAMGAGVAGASMSRYEGLIHNVSAKNACTALSVMNAFAAIMYMAIEGTVWFYTVDHFATGTSLSSQSESWRAAFAMVVIIFILAFFDMIVAFMTVILCALWMPRENNSSAPSPYVSERIVEEPYVVREERVPYSRSHTGAYGRPYDYYNGGYRTLPALKY